MSDSYVTSKAILKCSFGDRTAKLTVYPDRTVELTTKPTANISDHISMYNIAPFGKCHTTSFPPTGSATAANRGHLTPMPCVPGTVTEWVNGKDDYIIKGKPALLKSSYCRCKYGGIITITDDGQIDTGIADMSKEYAKTKEEMQAETEEKFNIESESVLNGIQLALDAAGLAPGVGAIPDLLNASISAIRGDWESVGVSVLAAVPIIGDAVTAVKYAKRGVNIARKIKRTEVASKSVNVGQPFGTLTAKQNIRTIKEANREPFLSITAKKDISEPSSSKNSELGLLTINRKQLVSTQTLKVDTNVLPSVAEHKSKGYPEDSLKEIFKYKGNNFNNRVKPKDSANKLDLSD